MSRDDPPLRIRLPEELKSKVQALAAENRRSMNAEIIARLEWSIQEEGSPKDGMKWIAKAKRLSTDEPAKRLDEIERRLAVLEDALIPDFTKDDGAA